MIGQGPGQTQVGNSAFAALMTSGAPDLLRMQLTCSRIPAHAWGAWCCVLGWGLTQPPFRRLVAVYIS